MLTGISLHRLLTVDLLDRIYGVIMMRIIGALTIVVMVAMIFVVAELNFVYAQNSLQANMTSSNMTNSTMGGNITGAGNTISTPSGSDTGGNTPSGSDGGTSSP